MSITVIDPNEANIPFTGSGNDKNFMINGIPQYQDMYIFAELTATPRPRTTLESNGIGNGVKVKTFNTNNDVPINFLGSKQGNDDFNKNTFSTNYYDGSVGENTQYEGFGISNIKVVINSSFIPQVDIQFTDIRGLTFFNQENSPYRILFDFPPPIFELTIKGYYGSSLTYQLHLVKYTSEFNSENGNYVIDAQFIAMTFAPLADIPFKYAVNFRLMDKSAPITTGVNNSIAPISTYDLILKLRALYSLNKSKFNNNTNNIEFEKQKTAINNIDETILVLAPSSFNSNFQPIVGEGTANLLINEGAQFNAIENIHDFDQYIIGPNHKKLFIAFQGIRNGTTSPPITGSRANSQYDALNQFKALLISLGKKSISSIKDNDIPDAYTFSDQEYTLDKDYIVLDITNFYTLLLRERNKLVDANAITSSNLTNDINKFVFENLGMIPTIYNIFNVILRDVDYFFNELRKTSQDAENDYSGRYSTINTTSGYNDVRNDKNKIYSFPLLTEFGKRVGPLAINNLLNNNFRHELDLINRFIDTFKTVHEYDLAANAKNNTNPDGNFEWIPYSPIDSTISNTTTNTPYGNNIQLNEIINVFLTRFYVISQFAFNTDFYKSKSIATSFAKAEAVNLILSLNNDKTTDNVKQFIALCSDANKFYDYLKQTNLVDDKLPSTDIPNSVLYNNGNNFNDFGANTSLDKTSIDFNGVQIIDEPIPTKRVENPDENDPIQKYFNDKTNTWLTVLSNQNKRTETNTSTQNLLFFQNNKNDGSVGDILPFNITNVWVLNLGLNYTALNNLSTRVKSIIYLSNWATIVSPFSLNLLYNSFTAPGIITVPKCLPAYLGSLVGLDGTSTTDPIMVELNNFLLKIGVSINTINPDIIGVNKYLSPNDKAVFLKAYDDFMGTTSSFDSDYKNLDNAIVDSSVGTETDKFDSYFKRHTNILNDYLLNERYVLNYSQLTFSPNNGAIKYQDLNTTNIDSKKKQFNDLFFNTFLSELSKSINDKVQKIKKVNEDWVKTSGDVDIINETYYSFKNVNDKWIAGMDATTNGYSFNTGHTGQLIDLFAFVDRAMNPIGNTIILNPEHLIRMYDDPDVSIYTVISSLLSLNGFEFFPLQNFMNISGVDNWIECFKINTNALYSSSPKFVCMYIGGSSSYPTGIEKFGAYGNQFVDDGITDLEITDVDDFSNSVDGVRAFKVKFGEQNQSMFTGIKIDSKEYPETNESIKILARLAGDQGANPPVPKGQNLYNLYENRSYKATINGLGNVMIQPTQYFQLENVPIFRGAYVILGVEHTVVPNNMKTSFYGTKVLKYPVTYVVDAASIVGFNGGSSKATSPNKLSKDSVTPGTGANEVPINAMYNSMHTYPINVSLVLTAEAKKSIKSTCNAGNKLINIGGGPLPKSIDKSTGKEINKSWTAHAKYVNYETGKEISITNGNELGDAIIYLLEHYAKIYQLDPNVLGAQIKQESTFNLCVYNKDSTAAGLNQFLAGTLYDVVFKNDGSSVKFTSAEQAKLAKGFESIKLSDGTTQLTSDKTNKNLYTDFGDINILYEKNLPARKFRGILFQNIIDNPDIMIKAQFRYMKNLSVKANNIASNTILGYYLGDGLIRPTYADSLKQTEAINSHADNYVFGIWKTLANDFNVPNILKSGDVMKSGVINPGYNAFTANAANSALVYK